MIKKCLGCGSKLQNMDEEIEGYIANLDNDLCKRCFRIKNYGDYKVVAKTNDEFISILKMIDKTRDLVLIVIDLFMIPADIKVLINNLSNDKLLILNKRDLFAKDIYNQKFLDYISGDFKEKIIISSTKNYNFDNLLGLINKYKKSKNVYVVGFTNSGKSTMINKLIYNYSNKKSKITTSILPSTTLDMINISLNENLTLIDTPGILDSSSIINYVNSEILVDIIPVKTIRPITYQVKTKQYFEIKDLFVLEVEDNNLTFFMSNGLEVIRSVKKPTIISLKEHVLKVNNEDVVINGLGFIKFSKSNDIKIYTLENVSVFKRESLI